MKELSGSAAQTVDASIDECHRLLCALEDYPIWYPDVVREVTVLERGADGHASRARTTLHVSLGPLTRDFHLVLAVRREGLGSVKLIRQPNEPSDEEEFQVSWRLTPQPEGVRIALELDAMLSVPRMLPIGAIGDVMAEGFVGAAARALSRSR